MKVDILAIGAHPDDIELSCAGTLLAEIAKGRTVGLLDLTQGELGTRGSAELRLKEAEEARRLMGAKFRINLGMADGFFRNTEENLKKVIQVIRMAQPSVVLANALTDRHIDHGRGAKLAADACFLSGLRKIETFDADGKIQEPWRPKAVYHYIQDYTLTPDFVVNITDYIDHKFELIKAFRSQFFDGNSPEPQTPISGEDFFSFLRGRFKTYGRPANYAYAEGYNVARTIGVSDIMSLD